MEEGRIHAASPDGRWTFLDGVLRSGEVRADVWEMDFFVRWTFARFLPGGQLALAFETSQPWNDWGSHGEPYGGVQVLALEPETGRWNVVAMEEEGRHPHKPFEPLDVAWHPRGVLAWLVNGWLWGHVLSTPRDAAPYSCDVRPDRAFGMEVDFNVPGPWHALEIDEEGRFLRAIDEWGFDVFDLELRRRAREGGEWESWLYWIP